jgi:hypothetical protein
MQRLEIGQFFVMLQHLEENSLSKYASKECQFTEDVWTFCMFSFTWKLNLKRYLQGHYTNLCLISEFQIGNLKPLNTIGLTLNIWPSELDMYVIRVMQHLSNKVWKQIV